jgi:hypothetical protein
MIMKTPDIDLTESNKKYKNDPTPMTFGGAILEEDTDSKIFVMNNHRLAYGCWKTHFDAKQYSKILMLHIDCHPDAVPNEYSIKDIPPEGDEETISWFTDKYLKWDNFIHPYIYEYADRIKYINLCHETELSNSLKKEYAPEKLDITNTIDAEYVFETIRAYDSDAVIIDLDLDYFTDDTEDLCTTSNWNDNHIAEFMSKLHHALSGKNVTIVTIATSPSCLESINDIGENTGLQRAERILSVAKPFLRDITCSKTLNP